MYKRVSECYTKYEPSKWNNNDYVEESHNCYAYFLDDINYTLSDIYSKQDEETKKILNPQPGHYCGMTKKVNYEETTCSKLIERVLCDNNNIQVIDAPDSNSFTCPPHYYKGALAINPKKMYHFYRQDANGQWSHKDGGGPVTQLDYSNNMIYDPKFSDKGEYNTFCTYFCVPENYNKTTNMGRNNFYEDKMWYM